MDSSKILAIVVSFNGLQSTIDCVLALLDQVEHVLVVDNGSEYASKASLAKLTNYHRVSLEFLDKNRGIGYALNVGTRYALKNGYRWILTMDQDSIIHKNMIGLFRIAIQKNPEWVCLCPSLAIHGKLKKEKDTVVKYAITSGNLIRVDAVRDVGFFDEELFIDGVDFDFSLRMRASGKSIHRIGDAILYHQLGNRHNFSGPLARFYTAHSPLRRYYMYRNFTYLAKRYFISAPSFIVKLAVSHGILLCLTIIYDDDPKQSMRMIIAGVIDSLMGRMGRKEER